MSRGNYCILETVEFCLEEWADSAIKRLKGLCIVSTQDRADQVADSSVSVKGTGLELI